MRRIGLLWLCCLCAWHLCAARTSPMDSLLHRLDRTIRERTLYREQKERQIDKLKQQLQRTRPDTARFSVLDALLDEYRAYNTDTSLAIAREKYRLALRIKDEGYLYNARMNTADIMGTAGMYKEAVDLMQTIRVTALPPRLHAYYYHIYRTVYGLMADYAVTEPEQKRYTEKTALYRDSLLLVNDPRSWMYRLVLGDRYNVRFECDEAIRLLSGYADEQPDIHTSAVCAYTLSESYRLKGEEENRKKYLILSSIADIQSAIREYISLRKLAVILYQEGDIDRAYAYLEVCMEDAVACNARLRILEILQIFPLINQAYQQKEQKRQEQIKWALVSISLLSLGLLLAMGYVWRQMKRISAARQEVVEANRQLKALNEALHDSNEQLKEANRSIAENSYLKETYIGRYMDLCSVYLEKMDHYRRSLGKMAAAGQVEELYKQIRSPKFIQEELKDFYANFDDTFLQLFPTFVNDFNALLAPGEQIYPKAGERMTTELRLFALIRLGITDSVKIAQFLRYSVTTIYNYRTKVRNKAAGHRDELEQQVMQIGKAKE